MANTPNIRFKGFADDWEQRKIEEICTYHSSSLTIKDIDEDGVYNLYDANSLIGKTNKGSMIEDYITIIKDGAGVGRTRLLPKNTMFLGTMGALTPKNSNLDFLFQLITKANLGKAYTGSTIPHIYFKDYGKNKYYIPCYDEQCILGVYFSNLDLLITLHQRKCDEVKQLKKFMLQKMLPKNGELIPEIRFAGFTDDWEQHKLGEFSDIKTGPFGSTLHADDYINDGMPIITTEHFKSGQLPTVKDGIPQVSENDYCRLSSYILNTNDIVFSRVGSVDINALVTPYQDKWLFSGRVLRVRPYAEIDSMFLHTLLETDSVRNDIISRAVGQTMPSINTEILKITSLCLPQDIDEQREIGEYFCIFDRLINLHQHKCDQLKEVKRFMLQNMFPQKG